MKTRIISDGKTFKIQIKTWCFFWRTVQRPEDLDNKDFGGDKSFTSKAEAEEYIKNNLTPPKWKVV